MAPPPAESSRANALGWTGGWAHKYLRWCLPPVLLITLFVSVGVRGIDFGYHWDERDYNLLSARTMIASGLMLSRPYVYPGFSRFLIILPSVDDGWHAYKQGGGIRQVLAAMASAFDAPNYLLQARSIFVMVSSLSILWVYLAVFVLSGRWWQAALASSILGLSWELSYHSRWLVNDCLLAQFAALCLLLLVLYQRRGHSAWLWMAAVVAGLATGTKYPGVLLLVPVMFCAALGTHSWWKRAARVIAMGPVAFGAYLVTTPGTVLDPVFFADGLSTIFGVYGGGHIGYTVTPGFPHFWRLLRYLTFNYFSPYSPIAVVFFASAVAGAIFCFRADRKLAAVLVGFPILFVTFFCWRYSVFIVRNFQLLGPFLAVLSAWALSEAFLRLRPAAVRGAVLVVVIGAFAANAAWLISAAESIRHRDDRVAAADAVAYVRDHPGKKFRISPRVAALAAAQGVSLPPNSVQSDPDEVVFFALSEGVPVGQWIVNDPWLTRAVFGTWEVNFNYYSTWSGYDRVVVMTREKARAIGSNLAQ